jgi:hypothetical protein
MRSVSGPTLVLFAQSIKLSLEVKQLLGLDRREGECGQKWRGRQPCCRQDSRLGESESGEKPCLKEIESRQPNHGGGREQSVGARLQHRRQ